MGRNNTRAAKNIAKMYEQLGLSQDDIFHKTKLLLSIYRDVVWATLSDCRCANAEINYYGDDLSDALIYLEEFAPDIEHSEFERRVCNSCALFQRGSSRAAALKAIMAVSGLRPLLENYRFRRILFP